MYKNEHYEIRIDDLGKQGEGIGHSKVPFQPTEGLERNGTEEQALFSNPKRGLEKMSGGFAFFVDGALPEDLIEMRVVKLKKNYGFGKLIRIIEPSPMRIIPKCPVAKRCGGCTLQHMDYAAQLRFKTKHVKDSLERIGGFKGVEVNDTIGMDEPYNYRNKAQFPVREVNGEIVAGFFSARSHDIVGVDDCCIQHKSNAQIISILKQFMTEYNISAYDEAANKGVVRHLITRTALNTGQIMVCLVINANSLPHCEALVDMLKEIDGMTSIVLNINRDKTNVILGKTVKVLWGQAFITDYIGGIKFNISPLSFFQVNPVQTKILYEKALELACAGENDVVIDAYCGIGAISLFFAQRCKKVYGIEIVPEAVADARQNAVINGINNVEFIAGLSEQVLPKLYDESNMNADIIIVDPPRKGCDEALLDAIIQSRPPKMLYISCDPSTLSRDLKILCAAGFAIESVQPVDLFPMTMHVETVVLLRAKDSEKTAVATGDGLDDTEKIRVINK